MSPVGPTEQTGLVALVPGDPAPRTMNRNSYQQWGVVRREEERE
ncbi:MAG: hypothetical protein OXG47_02785 [bacterium]|nr:hypothetical protein [bacterium]